ncbi:MAG: PLP-dependent aminotransferase family protein [Anaerolineae bacterium]|jgi:2-aminoadipate transaminase|nr:PLP-dependent aminotransferase family protein [Anaerolineae bacterium]MBT3714441.1 PLP-dependent aminotransferase family protein [Anaerolineae bacterium]MBT4311743.1 PLP-dependent aminotransferase family protein [Anaerolineae bacterium]MBT4458553.1 PLP-dependent aminotransferase family protein [Anaerolineae bacterium]MBT4840855.1 PLP-dependent aminotransferase family protein [Anaerolineae bacterium]
MNTNKNIVQTICSTDFIDLGMGNPDFNLLPDEILRLASEKAFTKGINASLQYGREQGNGYFRVALADFLTGSLDKKVDADSLFISTGSSSALNLLTTLYTKAGDTVFVEEPTYFLALRIFADHGLRVISIPIDEEGLNADALEDELKKYQPKLLYTIPTFQNPSGHTLSLERREKLIELAEKHDFLIVADEVYHLLPYGNPTDFKENSPSKKHIQEGRKSHQKNSFENLSGLPLKPFALFAKDSTQIASLNSFSKILAPGLRLGWVQAHPKVLKKIMSAGLLDSGGGMNPFTSAIVHELVTSGDLEKNIALLRRTYHSRLNVMDKAIKEMLPSAEYTLPQGGFFFWVRIRGQNTTELRQHAKEFKVDFRQGVLFSANQGMTEYMRLCFAFYSEDEIIEGVERLSHCIS